MPYLRLIALFAFVQEPLDYQGPLVPFEEQFELPAVSIKCSYGQRLQDKAIGSEDDFLTALNFLESTAPKVLGIMLQSVKLVAKDRLISNNAACSIDFCRIYSAGVHIGFGVRGEKSARLSNS